MIEQIIQFYNSFNWNRDISVWRRNVHREGHSWHLSKIIYSLFRIVKPVSYLEIGVCEGDSLTSALLAKDNIKKLYLVDNWGNEYGGSNRGNSFHIEEMLKKRRQNAQILTGSSKDILPQIEEKFQAILVDGDHSEEGAFIDLKNAWNLLENSGYLLFDDICHPAHRYLGNTLTEFLKGKNYQEYRIYDGYGVAIIQKPGKEKITMPHDFIERMQNVVLGT